MQFCSIDYGRLFSILDKPFIKHLSPENKKFNAAYGKKVKLGIVYDSNPRIILIRSCEFVNQKGVSLNLPPDSYFGSLDTKVDDTWLVFNFTSHEYYGNYSFNLTNAIGSTTVTFEVLPEG